MGLNKRLIGAGATAGAGGLTPSENFKVVTYTGNGGTQNIDVGFQPDLVWIKNRNNSSNSTFDHSLFDSQRSTFRVRSNSTGAQNDYASHYGGITANGFQVKNGLALNDANGTYVAWCWKSGGGTTSNNTDGTNIDSTVQVNAAAGFSIVQFTTPGTFSASNTVGHGLGVTPNLIIMKSTSTAGENWMVHTTDLGNGGYIRLNSDDASGTSGNLFTGTTSTVFNPADTSAPNISYIAYCFASVANYSSIGSYTGNGAITGPLVNTGFEPAMIILKEYDGVDNWAIVDNKRSTTNPRQNWLRPNLDNAEFDNGVDSIIFLSNGFQIGGGSSVSGFLNENGKNYIYIAFAADASAAPALPDSFANKLYTGTSATHAITGLGFSPSLVWIKDRGNAEQHVLNDIVRNAGNDISSNSTAAQANRPTGFLSFDNGGFTLGTDGAGIINDSARGPYVAWNWKASPAPTINTDGTIQSLVSANQAAGFSVVVWTGDGSASATVGHGLSGTPDFIMLKDLTDLGGWNGAQVGLASNEGIALQSNAGAFTGMGSNGGITYANLSATNFGFATGSSGVDSVNKNGNQYVAYCWKSIAGFSSIASYSGNGGSKAITGLGFQPDWVLIKSTGSGNWMVYDNLRTVSVGDNPGTANARPYLIANNDGKENGVTSYNVNLDSDGFSMDTSAGDLNTNSQTYIYMAYKENPVQYPIPSGEMGYLVAAGGGSGHYSQGAGGVGGGGAGGFRTTYGLTSGGGASAETNLTLATGTYTVTVGAGGAMVASAGNNGSDSSITGVSSITTVGGGGGAAGNAAGAAGGSGSGAGELNSGTSLAGGAGTANQGFTGGTSVVNFNGGGGGGAASVGGNNGANLAGNGGVGITSAITGSNVGYAGGGGGSAYQASSSGGLGSSGGGDGTLNGIRTSSTAGGINTGGGGGALGGSIGAAGYTTGGSGVVVLRLNTSDYSGSTTGSPTITTNGSETILTYTGSGTYVHS